MAKKERSHWLTHKTLSQCYTKGRRYHKGSITYNNNNYTIGLTWCYTQTQLCLIAYMHIKGGLISIKVSLKWHNYFINIQLSSFFIYKHWIFLTKVLKNCIKTNSEDLHADWKTNIKYMYQQTHLVKEKSATTCKGL